MILLQDFVYIYSSSGKLLYTIKQVVDAALDDRLSGELTFNFTVKNADVPDIDDTAVIKFKNQYYNITGISRKISDYQNLTTINCEQESISLSDCEVESFSYTGLSSGAINQILAGTGLSSGTVISGNVTLEYPNRTNRRELIVQTAAQLGGEITYSEHKISIVVHRGSTIISELSSLCRIADITQTIDKRSGTVAYEIAVDSVDNISVGDEVRIIYTPLGIDTSKRITGISYNPFNCITASITCGDYVPDVNDIYDETSEAIDYINKSLSDYAKKSEVSASIDTYVNSEAGRASIVASLSGTYVTESDLSGYVNKTELSAEIGAYIDTQAGTAKIVNNLTGTFAKTDALGNYVQKTELSTEIGSYIDTSAGTAKIVSAASGTFQKKSDMGNYVTTTTLNTSIAQYIDSSTGTAKIVSACAGTYAKQTDLSGYAKVSAVTSVEQSVSNVESKISLTASYGSGTIGSNVRALLTLVTNADSSSIKLKASAVEIDGTVYMKTSDYVASGTTMIRGAKIQTSDLYIEQLRTSAGKVILDYSGSTVSVGSGSSSSGSFATMSNIDLFASNAIRIGYGSVHCGFYYESAHFSLRAATSSDIFYVGTSTYPVDYIYCDNLYVGGTKITGGSSSSTAKYTSLQVGGTSYYWKIDENAIIPSSTASSYFNIGSASYQVNKLYAKEIYINGTLLSASGSSSKFTSLQVGGTSYYWKIDENAIIPNSSAVSYFKIGSSLYPITTLYAKEIYLDGTKLTAGGSSSGGSFAGSTVTMGGTTSYYITCNTSRELRPSNTSTSYPCYLGTSSYYWHYAYIGANTAMIGSSASSKLGFFGKTAVARQTVSSTATVATLIEALKKYGLIA